MFAGVYFLIPTTPSVMALGNPGIDDGSGGHFDFGHGFWIDADRGRGLPLMF
jgi:hypothetical protein